MIEKISSLQNSLVKHLVHLRQNHDYREEHKSVAVSGIKLVNEILPVRPLKTLLVLNESLIPQGVKKEKVFLVTEEIMKKASGLLHPEGILAEFELPDFTGFKGFKKIVALDRISDPGNLGTILRTALAFGFEGAFIVEGSTDPYNDKAISAARGASFKLPLKVGSWKELEHLIKENNLFAVVGDLEGEDLSSMKPQEKLLLILSNEAHGVSKEAANCAKKVTIPISNQMESLNVAVAAGILMYGLKNAH